MLDLELMLVPSCSVGLVATHNVLLLLGLQLRGRIGLQAAHRDLLASRDQLLPADLPMVVALG